MIIVSQKNKIINYDNIVEISVKDLTIYDFKRFGIIAETVNNKVEELGIYDTEERAKEVLEEIVRKYVEYVELTSLGEGIKQVYKLPKVYRMPKE